MKRNVPTATAALLVLEPALRLHLVFDLQEVLVGQVLIGGRSPTASFRTIACSFSAKCLRQPAGTVESQCRTAWSVLRVSLQAAAAHGLQARSDVFICQAPLLPQPLSQHTQRHPGTAGHFAAPRHHVP